MYASLVKILQFLYVKKAKPGKEPPEKDQIGISLFDTNLASISPSMLKKGS